MTGHPVNVSVVVVKEESVVTVATPGVQGPPGPPDPDASPVGTIIAFAGQDVPDKWLVCDGSAVSRTTYAELFAQIGTTYGPGDGVTTFNLPDFRSIHGL